MRIVLVGPPGAGKGTQAALLAKNLSIPHVSTGDLFRANISKGTELGRQAKAYMEAGNLVPDEVTVGMAWDRMEQPDAAGGFLLDGFPRNVAQAVSLDGLLKEAGLELDAVLDLEVPEDEVVKRIMRPADLPERQQPRLPRHVLPAGARGRVRHLRRRAVPARRRQRGHGPAAKLEVYHEETEPIIDYFKAQGLVTTISALGSVAEVTRRAMEALPGEVPADRS